MVNPKILLILEGWHLGGTERYVERLCQHLYVSGTAHVSLALLTAPDPRAVEEIRHYVREIHVVDGGRRRSMAKLRHLLGRESFDALHLHLYSNLLPMTLLARYATTIPVLTTLHMPLTPWSFRHRVGWRMALKLSNRVVANSRAVADSLGRRAATADVIPGCIDAPNVQYAPRPNDDDFRIVGVGRLSREKSWATLIDAVAKARGGSARAITCRIIGDGSERNRLRALAEQRGVSDLVELPGSLPYKQIPHVLAAADLFVLPSRFEGLGLAPLEAMAAGVPTITSDFPAAREFIDHGQTGHRFPIGDSAKLAELIRWHCDHPTESAAIGQRGRTAVLEQFSEENTIARYAEIYANLAGVARQGVRQ